MIAPEQNDDLNNDMPVKKSGVDTYEERKSRATFFLESIGEEELIKNILEKMTLCALAYSAQTSDVSEYAIKALETGRTRFNGQLCLLSCQRHYYLIPLNARCPPLIPPSERFERKSSQLVCIMYAANDIDYEFYRHLHRGEYDFFYLYEQRCERRLSTKESIIDMLRYTCFDYCTVFEKEDITNRYGPFISPLMELFPHVRARTLHYLGGNHLAVFLRLDMYHGNQIIQRKKYDIPTTEFVSFAHYNKAEMSSEQFVKSLRKFKKFSVLASEYEIQEILAYFLPKWLDGTSDVEKIYLKSDGGKQNICDYLNDKKEFMLVLLDPLTYIYYFQKVIHGRTCYALCSAEDRYVHFLDITQCDKCYCSEGFCSTKLEEFINEHGGGHLKGKIHYKQIVQKWRAEAAKWNYEGEFDDLGFAIFNSLNITYLKQEPQRPPIHWATLLRI